MEQIKAFIEKSKTDSELMAKLDTLGRKGAEGVDEAVALAAEYGFTVTKEDMEAARRQNCPHHGQLSEEELDAVSGGWTQNRYNPTECAKYDKQHYWCVGFMEMCHCDHLRYELLDPRTSNKDGYYDTRISCGYGFFDYVAKLFYQGSYSGK